MELADPDPGRPEIRQDVLRLTELVGLVVYADYDGAGIRLHDNDQVVVLESTGDWFVVWRMCQYLRGAWEWATGKAESSSTHADAMDLPPVASCVANGLTPESRRVLGHIIARESSLSAWDEQKRIAPETVFDLWSQQVNAVATKLMASFRGRFFTELRPWQR